MFEYGYNDPRDPTNIDWDKLAQTKEIIMPEKRRTIDEALALVVQVLETEIEIKTPFHRNLIEQSMEMLTLLGSRSLGDLNKEEQEAFLSLDTAYELVATELDEEDEEVEEVEDELDPDKLDEEEINPLSAPEIL